MARSSKRKGGAGSTGGHGRSGRPGGRPRADIRPAGLGDWIVGARLHTLPLSIVPVVIGFGASTLAYEPWYEHWARAVLCLVVALALQIGVNYANDYSDGIRGTDEDRVGPQRLVGSGRAKPRQVLTAALAFFAIAAVAGLVVAWRSGQWWLIAVGAVCILAAWFYTGGKRPYGYLPLGELAVFVFFGLVPALFTAFVLGGQWPAEAWFGGAAAGFFAAAVLLVNNLRDREHDAAHHKRTLAVLLGKLGSQIAFTVLLALPFGALAFFVLFYPYASYVYFALLAAIPAALITWTYRSGRELVTALQVTTVAAFLYGMGLTAALIF